MRTAKWLISILALAIFTLMLLALRSVPIPAEQDCLSVSGTIASISQGGVHDVVVTLEGIDRVFYINRGLERGLEPGELCEVLTGAEVVIRYPKYWTPLDPGNHTRHVSKLEYEGRTVFSELE